VEYSLELGVCFLFLLYPFLSVSFLFFRLSCIPNEESVRRRVSACPLRIFILPWDGLYHLGAVGCGSGGGECAGVRCSLPGFPACGACAHGQVPVRGAGATACVRLGYPGVLMARGLFAGGEAGGRARARDGGGCVGHDWKCLGRVPHVCGRREDRAIASAYRLSERELRVCVCVRMRMPACGVDVCTYDGTGSCTAGTPSVGASCNYHAGCTQVFPMRIRLGGGLA
jgi:hypothetical protein